MNREKFEKLVEKEIGETMTRLCALKRQENLCGFRYIVDADFESCQEHHCILPKEHKGKRHKCSCGSYFRGVSK